jgi:predicted nucleic acid-binding protein
VFLDTATLFPFILRDTLLRCASKGLFFPFWSETVLHELHRALLIDARLSADAIARLIAQLTEAFPLSSIPYDERSMATFTNDPKDQHVLAAEVAADSATIVTPNVRHFPPAAVKPCGIEAISPDDFLCRLFDTFERPVLEVIRVQHGSYRNPPITIEHMLSMLTLHAPRFVAMLRERDAS